MGQKSNTRQANWRVYLFPYLEMDNVYNAVNRADTWASAVLQNAKFPAWECPSSSLNSNPTDATYNNGSLGPNGQQVPAYIGIMGAYPDPAARSTVFFASNYGGYYTSTGMLLPNEFTSLTKCPDGTSNTIIVAEQSGAVGTSDIRNRYYSPWGGCTFSQAVSSSSPPSDSWGMGLTSVLYAINAKTSAAGSNSPYDANTVLNSDHAGGINCLFTDGGVRFIGDDADFANFQKLCVRNDGLTAIVEQ
jgi:prepilin-type processing-associated H-X9-DG protein